jgi:bifunctional ADP-heptose synthase (sugar kinase/adenylyltransferase)
VRKNETQSGLKNLHTFVKRRANANILTLTIPYRHDLSLHSCVNKEIQTYNRKLHKMMKNIDVVKVFDYKLGRISHATDCISMQKGNQKLQLKSHKF